MGNHCKRRSGLPSLLRSGFLIACIALGSQAAAASGFDDNELLLLDFSLGRERIATAITAYQHGSTTFLSLTETAAALEFPISVDSSTGRASGWFIHPERLFELDPGQGRARVDGTDYRATADDVRIHDGDLFVSLDALARWLPVDSELDRHALRLELKPREQLPLQARAQRRRQAGGEVRLGPAVLPEIDNSYRALGLPAADLGLSYSVRRKKGEHNASYGLSYAALVSADLAWMDARLYLSGDRNDEI